MRENGRISIIEGIPRIPILNLFQYIAEVCFICTLR
jgi:hypothetical protein